MMNEFRCPACRATVDLVSSPDAVACPACRTRFPLLQGAIIDFLAGRERREDHVGAMFREEAAAYDARFRVDRAHGRWVLEQLLEREPRLEKSPRAVVEIGAGTGPLTRSLATGAPLPFERLYVTDLAPEMLTINWRQRDPEEPADRVRYLVCNGLDLPFPDGSIDFVVGLDILHHILDYAAGLREIARVLAPGAVCVLKEPHVGAYRLFTWLGDVFLRADRRWPFSRLSFRDRRAIRIWQDHVEALVAAGERNDLESLSRVDDKYFFDPAALSARAKEAGYSRFSECNILYRRDLATPYGPMILDTFRGVGVSERGLAFLEEICAEFDRRVGQQMLERFPVNTLFLFWR